MSDTTPNTLFELLGNYKVEIPKVQRDYAQGRHDDHAIMVRKDLLKDIKSAIQNETKPLDLNFVYGKAENKNFIPIDGQQRLTTLFLLYLYAFQDDESKDELLGKFTYETRISSRKFFEELIKRRKSVFRAEQPPSREIEDSEWFVTGWKYDPTIQSALTMLDEIKTVFSGVNNLAQRLSDNESKPVMFEFLDMKNLGMEDSLYIKLNARGLQLTDLENFKARLISQLQKLGKDFANRNFKSQFENLLDGKWTDLFWSRDKKNFDRTYLAFFGVLLMNKGICPDDDNWSNRLEYEKIGVEIFETAFYTLNFLSDNQGRKEIQQLVFNALIKEPTYKARVLFHTVATYMYITKYDNTKSVENESFKQWTRITRNLVVNSEITSLEGYRSAIDSINKLVDCMDNLLGFFSKDGKPAFFNQKQVAEEQKKARIILQNKDFAEEIYKAEQHPYFGGQIRSALYYAIDKNTDIKVFLRYWGIISALFNDTGPIHGHLLRQALLTFGDYTLQVRDYKTLCVDDPNEAASTPSLKQLFSERNEVAKNLLDTLTLRDSIGEQLATIIKNSTVPRNTWQYCFISDNKFKLFTGYMSVSHLRLRLVDGEIIMVRNKSSNGYNYGVFLSALYELLLSHGLDPEFGGDLGTIADRYLTVKELQARFKDGKFIFTDTANIVVFKTTTNDPITEALTYLVS